MQVRVRSRTAGDCAHMRRGPVARGLAAATVLALAVTGCTEASTNGNAEPSPTPVSESTATTRAALTFGVYGPVTRSSP